MNTIKTQSPWLLIWKSSEGAGGINLEKSAVDKGGEKRVSRHQLQKSVVFIYCTILSQINRNVRIYNWPIFVGVQGQRPIKSPLVNSLQCCIAI